MIRDKFKRSELMNTRGRTLGDGRYIITFFLILYQNLSKIILTYFEMRCK